MEAFYHIIKVVRLSESSVRTRSQVKTDVCKLTGLISHRVTTLSRLVSYFGDCLALDKLLKCGDSCYFIFSNFSKGSFFYPLFIDVPFIHIDFERSFKYIPLTCSFSPVVLSAVYDKNALSSFDECISFLHDRCPGATIVPGQSYFPI